MNLERVLKELLTEKGSVKNCFTTKTKSMDTCSFWFNQNLNLIESLKPDKACMKRTSKLIKFFYVQMVHFLCTYYMGLNARNLSLGVCEHLRCRPACTSALLIFAYWIVYNL